MKEAQRIREKGGKFKEISGTYSHTFPQASGSHPDPIVRFASTRETYRKYEFMWDTHGFLKDDFNPCYHEHYVGLHNLPSSLSYADSNGGSHQINTSFKRQLADPVLDCRNISLPIGEWIEDFSARAENHFLVLVDTEFSMANFIIEIIQLFEGNVSILATLKKGIEGAIAAFRRKFAETGNYWLSWNFAIKPTIADIKAMFNVYQKAQKRLKWLKSRNHKDTKVKYREGPREFEGTHVFTVQPTITDPYYFSPDPATYCTFFKGQKICQEWSDWCTPFLHVEAEYFARVRLSSWAWIRFDIDDGLLEGAQGIGIVLAAMQGLYNPLDVGWEAVPFSWLIDWFRTEAHKLRERLKSDINPFGVAEIIKAGWSADITIFGNYFAYTGMVSSPGGLDPDLPQDQWPKQEAGAFRYKLYNRQPELPIIGGSPFRIPFQWYNASILTALIQQKTRRG